MAGRNPEQGMKIIAFCTGVLTENEISIAKAMLQEGLYAFHIHKPAVPTEALRWYLGKFDNDSRSRLVLHQSYHLCLEQKVGGIHLTRKWRRRNPWLTTGAILLMRLTGRRVTRSVHRARLIRRVGRLYSYVFFSPLFDPISKSGKAATWEEEELKNALKRAKVPVIALGGITTENVHIPVELGFSGVAVRGALWRAADPLSYFLKLKERIAKIANT